MTTFAYELATLLRAQEQARPGHPEGAYSMPWYLVLGEPGSGRSSAIAAMNLSWPYGEGPLPLNQPHPSCDYWLSAHAAFIEPGPTIVGHRRAPNQLRELVQECKEKRPREPLDGLILVINVQTVVDAREDDVDRYAKSLRRYLIEVAQTIGEDIPTYIVVTGYDTLWGFGDAFQWTADRRDEDPWGFWIPPDVEADQIQARVEQSMQGLLARIEAMCIDKISHQDPCDVRTRAFQHLLEARAAFTRLSEITSILSMGNAFEIAPWIRALALGSGIPGTGERLRYNIRQLAQMGMYPPSPSGTPQPGGLPLHAYLDYVLLPERDIVPTHVRWRDDKIIVGLAIAAMVVWVITILAAIIAALV